MLKSILLVALTIYVVASVPLMIWRGFARTSVTEGTDHLVFLVINRRKSPVRFWLLIALHVLVGAALIATLANRWS